MKDQNVVAVIPSISMSLHSSAIRSKKSRSPLHIAIGFDESTAFIAIVASLKSLYIDSALMVDCLSSTGMSSVSAPSQNNP